MAYQLVLENYNSILFGDPLITKIIFVNLKLVDSFEMTLNNDT